MINLKLTPAQAQELAELLSMMVIEPEPTDGTLLSIMDQPTEHQLWPVLVDLRWQLDHQPRNVGFCEVCDQPIALSKRGGQPKKYCSGACKQKATRARAASLA